MKLYCKSCFVSKDSPDFVVQFSEPTNWLEFDDCSGACYACGTGDEPKTTKSGWYSHCAGQGGQCRSSSLFGQNRRVVGLMGNKNGIQCPLTLEYPQELLVFSCNHVCSVAAIRQYFGSSATIANQLVKNINVNRTVFGSYMLRCPQCSSGGLCLETLRIFPDIYKHLIADRIEYFQNTFAEVIYCGLPSHPRPNYFQLDPNLPQSTEVDCPVCRKKICKYCGTEWKVGNCGHYKADDVFNNHLAILVDILTNSATVCCPKCKRIGVKSPDNQHDCTHIHCDCNAIYCYCCEELIGREEGDDCTKTGKLASEHNVPLGRCPLYLNRDYYGNRWKDEEEATAVFLIEKIHKNLTEYRENDNIDPILWKNLIHELINKYQIDHLNALL